MPRNVQITNQDIQELISRDPLFAEKLRTVALERLLEETEAKLAEANGQKSEPIPDAVQ